MKLIRLINGTWVLPAAVTCVKVEASTGLRVIIMHSGTSEIIECDLSIARPTWEARKLADDIADTINAAMTPPAPKPAPKKRAPAPARKKPSRRGRGVG